MNYSCLGIDPGLTGAGVVVDRNGQLITHFDMPVQAAQHGKGQEINPFILCDRIEEAMQAAANVTAPVAFCLLERVASMPKQGVSSTFKFGTSYGITIGVLAALGIGTKYARPNDWKKFHSLTKKDKEAALGLCIQNWPDHRGLWARKKDVGRADAALIASYGVSERLGG